jgi:hypothetical protein
MSGNLLSLLSGLLLLSAALLLLPVLLEVVVGCCVLGSLGRGFVLSCGSQGERSKV